MIVLVRTHGKPRVGIIGVPVTTKRANWRSKMFFPFRIKQIAIRFLSHIKSVGFTSPDRYTFESRRDEQLIYGSFIETSKMKIIVEDRFTFLDILKYSPPGLPRMALRLLYT